MDRLGGPKVVKALGLALLLALIAGFFLACTNQPPSEPCDCPPPKETVIPHGTGEWLGMATAADDSFAKLLGQGAIIRENEWRRANGLPEIELPKKPRKPLAD